MKDQLLGQARKSGQDNGLHPYSGGECALVITALLALDG